MKAKLYDLMNWAQIEGIVYSEEDRPGTILGPHVVGNSTLYQTFYPGAKKFAVDGKEAGLPILFEEGPGGHDWAFWDKWLPVMLDHMLKED